MKEQRKIKYLQQSDKVIEKNGGSKKAQKRHGMCDRTKKIKNGREKK